MADAETRKVQKADEEWRALLTPEQYRITREQGTERPFTGPFLNNKQQGTYRCVCCGRALFRSDTKFDSGCGWPSYFAPVDENAIAEHVDRSAFHGENGNPLRRLRRPSRPCLP